MTLPVLTFWIFAALIVGSSLMVVTRRNTIASALFLALSLVAVAGLYVSLKAEFLFAVQVLVYTGGVMVLFLFVIMLVNVDELKLVRPAIRRWAMPVALTAFTFAALAWFALPGGAAIREPGPNAPLGGSNTEDVARVLLTSYLLPFEILSILLLVAMLGAIVLSKREI